MKTTLVLLLAGFNYNEHKIASCTYKLHVKPFQEYYTMIAPFHRLNADRVRKQMIHNKRKCIFKHVRRWRARSACAHARRLIWLSNCARDQRIRYALFEKQIHHETRLYNFDPLEPHFYIVKLGSTGVYIIFLISAQNIDCGYSLEPSFSENLHFLVVKFSVHLNTRVFVMIQGFSGEK